MTDNDRIRMLERYYIERRLCLGRGLAGGDDRERTRLPGLESLEFEIYYVSFQGIRGSLWD